MILLPRRIDESLGVWASFSRASFSRKQLMSGSLESYDPNDRVLAKTPLLNRVPSVSGGPRYSFSSTACFPVDP